MHLYVSVASSKPLSSSQSIETFSDLYAQQLNCLERPTTARYFMIVLMLIFGQNAYAFAESHLSSQLLPRCFNAWRCFVEIQQHKGHLAMEAQNFRRWANYDQY